MSSCYEVGSSSKHEQRTTNNEQQPFYFSSQAQALYVERERVEVERTKYDTYDLYEGGMPHAECLYSIIPLFEIDK